MSLPPSPRTDREAGVSRRRVFAPQWRLAADTLAAVVEQGRAADRLLQEAFRTQRQMGGRDRAVVTDLVYGTLRDLRRLQRIAGSDRAEHWCALHALDCGLADGAQLGALGLADAAALQAALQQFDAATLTPAQRHNVPDAIWAHWCAERGDQASAQLADALRAQAPVDLRVNSLRATRAEAQAALAAQGIDAVPTPWAPLGLRLPWRAALQASAPYREGWIEPQDEGSQLLALLVAARPGERIADYCAGAGGKTLALAAQMQDRGELVAMDRDAGRLQRLRPRLQRAGVHCVRLQPLPATAEQHFDAVLVDAPCSGTGTWRRQPEARLKPLDLPALTRLQAQILADAAACVRPGGRLIYATCSLLRAENQGVIEPFVAAHSDFVVEDAGNVLQAGGVDLPGRMLQLDPQRHGTDGFFGACLRRRATA